MKRPILGIMVSSRKSYWERLKKTADGATILANWISQGAEPVSEEHAMRRANICAYCIHNHLGSLSDFFTDQASEIIRRQVSCAKELELTTSYDDKLGVCGICSCPLKLKVHIPIAELMKRIPKESLGAFGHNCWIPLECFSSGYEQQ